MAIQKYISDLMLQLAFIVFSYILTFLLEYHLHSTVCALMQVAMERYFAKVIL